jgi:hypothetical protein
MSDATRAIGRGGADESSVTHSAHSVSHIITLARNLQAEIESKVTGEQRGVPTYFDTTMLEALRQVCVDPLVNLHVGDHEQSISELLMRLVEVRKRDRFVKYATRAAETAKWVAPPWEPGFLQLMASQGLEQCISWRGYALFKTVFDLAVYPMLLSDLRPASVVELGSGTGASAMWLADILRAHQISAHVYSVDLHQPRLEHPGVTFIRGNCGEMEDLGERLSISYLPHRWLIIEDAHVNTLGVMRYFRGIMQSGDYLIIEDSRYKRADLATFAQESGSMFVVDSRYTDFFGRNTTCSADSIFVKL